jgi:hypothetical protein
MCCKVERPPLAGGLLHQTGSVENRTARVQLVDHQPFRATIPGILDRGQ